VGPLIERIEESLAEIAHLKVFDRAGGSWVKAGITGNGQDVVAEGDLLADAAVEHELVVNLRAEGDPEELRDAVLRAIEGRIELRHVSAFRPAYPRPEHRFTSVAP
jgi:hypothetical protein